MMWKVYLFFIAIHLVLLSNLCCSMQANQRRQGKNSQSEANQSQNVLDRDDIADGRIFPISKSECVRELSAEILYSKKLRNGIEEKLKKGIKDAFEKNKGRNLLWVSLIIDIDKFSGDSLEYNPKTFNLEIYAILIYSRTKIKPIVLLSENGNDWQGSYIKQDLLYVFPENSPPDIALSADNVELMRFKFFGYPAIKLMEKALEQNSVFPKIKLITTTRAFGAITSYAKTRDLKPLEENHMRYFLQPKGYVSQCIDINLVSGEILAYPGTHETIETLKAIISPEELKEIRDLLTSKDFIRVPQMNDRIGFDGVSHIFEVDIDGSYMWKMHWSTQDENFIEAISKMSEIIQKYKKLPSFRERTGRNTDYN